MKKRIRLTEAQLHNVIRKCINEEMNRQKLGERWNYYRNELGDEQLIDDVRDYLEDGGLDDFVYWFNKKYQFNWIEGEDWDKQWDYIREVLGDEVMADDVYEHLNYAGLDVFVDWMDEKYSDDEEDDTDYEFLHADPRIEDRE